MANSVSSTSSSSFTRITGMYSNMDTDSIVASLLKVDQAKVDKVFQRKAKLQYKADALDTMVSLVKNFRNANLSTLNPDKNMYSSAAYKAYAVTMLDDTNAVTVTANSKATAGEVTINKISQLAAAAKMSSASAISTNAISYGTKLSELDLTNKLQFEDDEIKFTINGQDFTFGKDATISDIINKVNSNADASVTMSYSSLKKGFIITSDATGSASSVTIKNVKGNAFAATNAAFGIAEGTASGKDAKLTIDGTEVTQSSNSFTIDGLSYTLKDTTDDGVDTTDDSVSFNVTLDVDTIYNKIKGFVDNYNSLISTMQSVVDEDTYSDYAPLTDEQREALSETQQTKWDTKAKSGILKNDSNIQSVLNSMRSAFYTKVASVGKSLSDIGLTTTSTYSDNGKIIINETVLRQEIANNPDEVASLFTSSSSSTDASTKFKESGVVTRISNALLNYTNVTTNVEIESNDKAIDDATDKLKDLKTWLSDRSSKYYDKFSKMEAALAKLNSQQSWLAQQVSAWSNG